MFITAPAAHVIPDPPPTPTNFSLPLTPTEITRFPPSLKEPQQCPYYTVADYEALYLSGQATPTDVALALLPLIRRDVSPAANHSAAWMSARVDLILKAAEDSTRRYRENRPLGPLDGVPAAVKDDFDVDGYEMTMGSSRNYAGRAVQSGSSTNWSVKKLQEAGVIIFGKLAMHEYGLGMS
ncbi:hypothetical protein G7Z17_g3858 [Cylindrodendrum hubeiense]|uniref:Amidase domain-containing protein n=1 Tax=Cylindrodendrum hubeiense TaxID=595255 RepID=A0A9P5HI10_9HYPO|nr:hypothetical protein G7Z17_g3858 [Cylindrodendrum hubeiense]